MKPLQSNRHTGFSVLELVISIGIILILITLIFPTVRYFKNKQLITKCMVNQRNTGVALHLYAADHNGRFPAFISGGITLSSSGTQNSLPAQLIPPKSNYLPDNSTFMDPGAIGRLYERDKTTGWANWIDNSSSGRSGYWHIWISPRSDLYPERADEENKDYIGANDTVLAPPYRILMHCIYGTTLEKCAHASGEVNVLRIDGSIQTYARKEYLPNKNFQFNFGYKRD